MGDIEKLAEQHIRESESHLRQIDELFARARKAASSAAVAPEILDEVSKIEQDRHRLAQELNHIRDLPAHERAAKVQHGEGIKHGLEAIGLQLEQLLTAVLNSRY